MSDLSDPPSPSADRAKSALAASEALPAGSRIAEFEVVRLLGVGGFGIVYLALDTSLQRQVAVKEYLPSAMAGRSPDGRVALRSLSSDSVFQAGLRSFVNEARLLARFDHPSLVKVHRFWEDNGTAYMVMPYYEGATLKQVRESMSVPPHEAWLQRILDSLLGALEVLHSASVYHRDVAPDNILLLPSATPVLLDFGAARHVLTGQTQTLTAMLKPAYAPIEQYADISEFRQGPWTDIYAVAATLHYCLTGKAPPTAAARAVEDHYQPLSSRNDLLQPASGAAYDAHWLAALDWGLAVRPHERPQSVVQWRNVLAGHSPVPAAPPALRPVYAAASPIFAGVPFPATQFSERAVPATQGEAPAATAVAIPAADGAITPSEAPVIRTAGGDAPLPLPSVDAAGDVGPPPQAAPPARQAPTARRTRRAWIGAAAALGMLALGVLLWTPGGSPGLSASTARSAALASAAPGTAGSRATDTKRTPVTAALSAPTGAVERSSLSNGRDKPPAEPSSDADASKPDSQSGGPDRTPRPDPSPGLPAANAQAPPKSPATAQPRPDRARPVATAERAQAKHDGGSARARPSPQEVCADRGFFGRLMCMRSTCDMKQWRKHPQCVEWHRLEQSHTANRSGFP